MDRYEELALEALKNAGAVLERQNKHRVFRFPDNSIWVMGSTPSDSHASRNNWRRLSARLGLNGPRGIPGQRRVRKVSSGARKMSTVALSSVRPGSTLAEKLSAVRSRVRPVYAACAPFERRAVYGSLVTVVIDRMFARLEN